MCWPVSIAVLYGLVTGKCVFAALLIDTILVEDPYLTSSVCSGEVSQTKLSPLRAEMTIKMQDESMLTFLFITLKQAHSSAPASWSPFWVIVRMKYVVEYHQLLILPLLLTMHDRCDWSIINGLGNELWMVNIICNRQLNMDRENIVPAAPRIVMCSTRTSRIVTKQSRLLTSSGSAEGAWVVGEMRLQPSYWRLLLFI